MKKMLIMLLMAVVWVSCKDEDFDVGTPPTEADAQFTYSASSESTNILVFTTQSEGFILNWDFGNGSSASGREVTATYPFQGEYEVTLTVFTNGGSVSTTQTVNIAQSDANLIDPLSLVLSGGVDNFETGKTWIIDAENAGHFGVGPIETSGDFVGYTPNYYAASANEKACAGYYDDEFTFKLSDFEFNQETMGVVYLNSASAPDFSNIFDGGCGDLSSEYTAPDNLTWSVSTDSIISISNGGFIGYYSGPSDFKIVTVTENELFIVQEDQNADLLWYQRLIPKP